MSWTYFTAPLDGTRPITKDERDELYAKWAEKLTGCAGHWSLNSTDQSHITSSRLITDLCSRVDADNSGNNGIMRLFTMIDNVDGLANYASVMSAALATEGLSTDDFNDLFNSQLDSYKYWNVVRAMIDGLAPGILAASTLKYRTSGASLSKCGYPENSGHESTPPKYYLKKSFSGTLVEELTASPGCTGGCSSNQTFIYSGYDYFPHPDCGEIGGANVHEESEEPCGTVTGSSDGDDPTLPCSAGFPCVTTATTITANGAGCVDPMGVGTYSGTARVTLSDEYTTTMLGSDVDAAMPAFSGSFSSGTPTAGYDISTSEYTITKSRAEYKFTLPALVSGQCYKLTWIERFSPEGGGSPTDTDKSYLWNGTDTETPVYTLGPPSAQGTLEIVSVAYSCACS